MAFLVLERANLQWGATVYAHEKRRYMVDLLHLCVALPDCIRASLGRVDEGLVDRLRAKRFEQAPIEASHSRIGWGIVTTDRLEALYKSRASLSLDDIDLARADIGKISSQAISLLSLLDHMREHRAVIFYEEFEVPGEAIYDQSETTWDGVIFGMVTLSDLNRHEIRRAGYELLLTVETGLADLIMAVAPDPLTWIKRLHVDEQARVLGYWELAKQKRVDANPITTLHIGQLLRIAKRSTSLGGLLGYRNSDEFNDDLSRILEFRNAIMHPIRPLVLDQSDVAKAKEAVRVLLTLATKIEVLDEIPPEGRHLAE